jgi:two-component system alkaline phosphatase synthesis response regulator PhoP
MDMPKILVVDDEEDLCEILKFNLEIEGYEVDTAFSAEEALKMDIASYQLLLLDVMMGEISGFKMASILKKEEKTADIPIIFLTAKDTENDMLTGFNLGADDYISKPFSIRQVVARVKAVLRRTSDKEKVPENECLKYETLSLDTKRIKASVDGQEVPLTKKEFEILKRVLTRGDPFPDMERRSICARPHHRCKHHPPAQKDRAIRQKHRDAARLRILL